MACYSLPFFHDITKKSQVGYKMQIKMYGVLAHGVGTFAYVLNKHWPSNANLIIEVLHRTISCVKTTNKSKILYLQVMTISI